MAPDHFEMGKVPPNMLEQIVFKRLGARNPNLLLGPRIGEDAAVVQLSTERIALSADPITGSVKDVGRLVVHVNANDIATHGAKPVWMLLTILLPLNSSKKTLEAIMKQVDETAKMLGITIAGGHTEITPAVNQPVLCGTVIGEIHTKKLITSNGAQPGDHIILTKGAGLEGTAIIAAELEQELMTKYHWSMDDIKAAKAHGQSLSIIKDAEIAVLKAQVTSMHDPTEGGIAGALHELADAAEKGLRIYAARIPISAHTQRICDQYHIDPLCLISSGALLVTVPEGEVEELLREYHNQGIPAADIGTILDKAGMRTLVQPNNHLSPLPRPNQDALWSVLKPARHTG